MKSSINVQDEFLNSLRTGSIPVVIYLVNGVKLQGKVERFDNFTVLLRSGGSGGNGSYSQQMVYKHAISTFVPERPVKISDYRTNPSPIEDHREKR